MEAKRPFPSVPRSLAPRRAAPRPRENCARPLPRAGTAASPKTARVAWHGKTFASLSYSRQKFVTPFLPKQIENFTTELSLRAKSRGRIKILKSRGRRVVLSVPWPYIYHHVLKGIHPQFTNLLCSHRSMGGIELDLNLDPPSDDLDQNDPIDWDGIEEWDGPAHELDYNLVWHDGDEAGEYYPIPKVA